MKIAVIDASARGRKILLPLTHPRVEIMGTNDTPLPKLIEQAVDMVGDMYKESEQGHV
jgi:hypothetical protein